MARPLTYKKGAHRAKILLTPESTILVAKAWSIMLAADPVNAPKDQTTCVARLLERGFSDLQNEETSPSENENTSDWG